MKCLPWCGDKALGSVCCWVSKVCTEMEKILRSNPVMLLVWEQIGAATIFS